jgi:hypothetical protein
MDLLPLDIPHSAKLFTMKCIVDVFMMHIDPDVAGTSCEHPHFHLHPHVVCRAGQFYADAGVPCPLHRALADHLIFTMNTDFNAIARDFATTSKEAQPAFSMATSTGMRDCTQPATATPDAERDVAALRDHFENSCRV